MKESRIIDVSLCLYGEEDFDPDAITKELGIDPSYSRRKGEKWLTSTNKERTAKIGVWMLDTESDSHKLADHVMQLASILPMNGDALMKLSGVDDDAKVDIFMISDGALQDGEISCEFELNKESIAALAKIGLRSEWTIDVDKPTMMRMLITGADMD